MSERLRAEHPAVRIEAEDALNQAVLASRTRLILSGHIGRVSGVAYSPDGQQIVTGGDDGPARVWDAFSGRERLRLSDQATGVFTVAFSPDAERIITAGRDSTARVYDSRSGAELLTLAGHTDIVIGVAFSHDNRRIATASYDNTAAVWDAHSGQKLLTLDGHTAGLEFVVFSPDDAMIATASGDKTARVWNAATGEHLLTLGGPDGHSDWVNHVAWSPDGALLATVANDRSLKIWDAASGALLASESEVGSDFVEGVAFGWDGRLATASRDGQVKVWQQVGEQDWQTVLTLAGHTDRVWSVAFSPDGERLVSASSDGTARVWDVSDELYAQQYVHDGAVTGIAFSGDSAHLATTSRAENVVRVWSVVSGKREWQLPIETQPVNEMRLNHDGSRLATREGPSDIRLWEVGGDLAAHTPATVTQTSQQYDTIQFTADGGQLLVVNPQAPERIQRWDVSAKRLVVADDIAGLEKITPTLLSVSPDGSQFAVVASNTLQVWDMDGAAPAFQESLIDAVRLLFGPDSRRVAALAGRHEIKVWSVSDRQLLLSVANPEWGEVMPDGLAFDGGGERLAVVYKAGERYAIRVFNLEVPGAKYVTFPSEVAVTAVAFSPDDIYLAVARTDGAVRLHRQGALFLQQVACGLVGRNLTDKEWEAHRTFIENPQICSQLPIHDSIVLNEVRKDRISYALALLRGMDQSSLRVKVTPESAVADALSTWARLQLEQSLYAEALDTLAQVTAVHPQPEPPQNVALAGVYADICQAADGSVDNPIVRKACSQAATLASQYEEFALNKRLCQQALADAQLASAVRPACVQAVALATGGNDAQRSLDLCRWRTVEALASMVAPACAHATTVALAASEPATLFSLCEYGVKAGLDDVILPVCQEMVTRAADQEDLSLNLRICRSTSPDGATALSSRACRQAAALATPVAPGQLLTGTMASGEHMLWSFQAEPGDMALIVLDSATDGAFEPFLRLYDAEMREVTTDEANEPGANALIAYPITEAGDYFVEAYASNEASSDYRFTALAQTPQPLILSRPVTRSAAVEALWIFTGVQGEILNVTQDALESDFYPSLTLLDQHGQTLLEASGSSEERRARITDYVLPRMENYLIRAGGQGASGPYEISFAKTTPTPLTLNAEPVHSSFDLQRSYSFSATAGQLVAITLETQNNELAPAMALLASDGAGLKEADSSQPGQARIDNFFIPSDGRYLIKLSGAADDAPYVYAGVTELGRRTNCSRRPTAFNDTCETTLDVQRPCRGGYLDSYGDG
jgi:WD40 repeat protein